MLTPGTTTISRSAHWYCARTKPKHEHIAAGNLVRNLGFEVFNPTLRVQRVTKRGLVRSVEPLFPCYIFLRCDEIQFNEVRFVSGISSLVHFGDQVPRIPEEVIADLKAHFESAQPLDVDDRLDPGSEVIVAEGAFRGLSAVVLRTMPARSRVQVLMDVLGRPTIVELDRHTVTLENVRMADLVPGLAVA